LLWRQWGLQSEAGHRFRDMTSAVKSKKPSQLNTVRPCAMTSWTPVVTSLNGDGKESGCAGKTPTNTLLCKQKSKL
jgi:hypothetical protein